ncbi:MAG: outer membrane beta-barrel protein [Hyphomicrobium sp.]|jgi:opacity protein-like surface antigen
MNTNRSSYPLGAVLGSAIVLAFCAPAMAADIYDGGLKGGYEVAAPPDDRGIYIKGYVGQANPNVGGMSNELYDIRGISARDHEIKSSPLFGIGVGWQARHWLRFDGTIEYRGDATFLGSDISTFPGANEYTADVKSWLGLANAYIDMGNWCGFTPYIGAGIGFATISVEGLRDDGLTVSGASIAYGGDKTSTNFAYAFYAGTSFDVTPQVSLDLTYRWANLGSAASGPVLTYDGGDGYSGQHLKDITSNDVMLGFRYKLQREAAVSPIK